MPSLSPVDILAIGAHPDDVELGCGGTLAKHVAAGDRVAILDLTRGEMGTRGTAELRDAEALEAAKILGVSQRVNAGMRDGFLENSEANQRLLIAYLRAFQPRIVLATAPRDRHPDHGHASQLIVDACFKAGLQALATEWEGQPQVGAPSRASLPLHPVLRFGSRFLRGYYGLHGPKNGEYSSTQNPVL